ncbi:hypothetical protein BKA58DRAFT_386013 [Alternaria rosae]|uniref:uncharacterized protein n=1 Tax=Alternaria rosae TaxID=1187941 RepID=UPI001E8CF2EA|nr:uncharacterized protein BKA58DRAFT_386013 [Alternaria rosae]KAH6867943.1 hypothetical protein BKA58DRAFT_386013 [Alternaria rosae]
MASPVLPSSRHFVTQLLDSLAAPPSIDKATIDKKNADTNPLNNVPDATRKQLLSLQVLFPNEFVPALDLLDRRLVTRFRICDEAELAAWATAAEQNDVVTVEDVQMQNTQDTLPSRREDAQQEQAGTHAHAGNANESTDQDEPSSHTTTTTTSSETYNLNTIYYVRSAQHRPSRFSTSYDTLTTYQVRLTSWNCSCPAFAFAAFPAGQTSPLVPLDKPTTQTQDKMGDNAWVFGGITLGSDMPPVCKHLLACVLVERCKGLFGGFVEERNVSVEEAAGWAAGWGD